MRSDPTGIVVTEPRDLVALVPYRLGFLPADSLVLVALRDPGSEVGLVLRVDLADVLRNGADGLEQLATHLADDGARRAVAVVYDDAPGASVPWLPVLDHVLERCGVDLLDCWHVGPHRFRSLLCVGQGCCPPDGWPVTDLQSATVSAQMVALGVSPAASRAELLPDLRPVAPAVRRRVAARVRRTPVPHGPSARVACLHAWLRVLGAPAVAEERDLALALVGLGEPVVRDAVVLTCTPDGRAAAEELVLTGGTGAGDALDALFDVAGDGPVPSPDRDQLAAASRRARAPGPVRPGTAPGRPAGGDGVGGLVGGRRRPGARPVRARAAQPARPLARAARAPGAAGRHAAGLGPGAAADRAAVGAAAGGAGPLIVSDAAHVVSENETAAGRLAAGRGACLPWTQVMSASVKPRLAGRQPSSAVGCPG